MRNQTRFLDNWPGLLCFMTAAVLLSAGYANVISWVVIPGITTALLLWWGCQRQGWRWLPPVLFVLQVCTAAGGVLLAKNPAWMIAGATAALAGWELTGQQKNRPGTDARTEFSISEPTHARLLAVVVIFGLVAAEAGLFLQVTVSFWGVFLVALLVLFSLYQFYYALTRK